MIALPTTDNPAIVVHGDAYETMRELATGAVQTILCDPPYSERTHRDHDASANGHVGEGNDGANRKVLGYGSWSKSDVDRFVPEMCRVCSGWVAIMTDHTLAPTIAACLESCGRYVFAPLPFYAPGSRCRLSGDGPSSWTDWIIVARTAKQHKWGTLPGGHVAEPGWRDREHMGGKPVKLFRALARDYSKPGDIILDPFAGSGTTALASLLEGRRTIAVEREAEHVDKIRRRVATVMCETPGTMFAPDQTGDLFASTE